MKSMMLVAAALGMAASGLCHGAAMPLKVRKSIVIEAPIDKVWSMTQDFNGLNSWHPAVAKDDIVSGRNNVPGAVRLLTLKDGGTIKEKLLGFDAATHTFRYSILEGVLPVSSYTSTFTVKAAGASRSTVTWSGHFKRKDTGDQPGEKENDKAAVDTINAVYQSGLDNLKKIAEGK